MRSTIITAAFAASALAAVVPRAGRAGRSDTWNPEVGSSYQIVLTNTVSLDSGSVSPDVEIFDIDLFDTPAEVIEGLHGQGKKVICYFSAGTSEDWRPDWADFQESDKGACLPEWPGERWLNVRSSSVWDVISKRIKLASEKGCDAIDPDNMDGYSNDNAGGIELTTSDAVSYIRKIAAEAGQYGMSTGLKNAGEIVEQVSDVISFAVNEECAAFEGDCDVYNNFDKPVYHIEYVNDREVSESDKSKYCVDRSGFTTVIKTLNLDGWVTYCDGSSTETPTSETAPQKGGQESCT